MSLPSEIIEPYIAKVIGKMWQTVEAYGRSAESLRKMYEDINILHRFLEGCEATHCIRALHNHQFFIYCLWQKAEKAKENVSSNVTN